MPIWPHIWCSHTNLLCSNLVAPHITPKFKPQARKILHPFLLKAAILPVYLATSIKNTAKSPLAFIVKIITIVTPKEKTEHVWRGKIRIKMKLLGVRDEIPFSTSCQQFQG